MRKWTTGALALPALAAGGVVGATPAGAQSAPLTGDLDGDHIADRATLIDSSGECSVSVELGRAGGGFSAARIYPFDVPGSQFPYCPDMGVIVDLGGDHVSELVLAWFFGTPVNTGNADLLVLRNFAPAGGFDAIDQPSTIRAKELNGDGLVDIYETTDQGEGFRSFLNTPSGQLVPGPLKHCHDDGFVQFGNFDGDAKADLAVSYVGFCPGQPEQGVAVVLDDGTRVQLTEDAVFGPVTVADANGDRRQDVGVIDSATGTPHVWYSNGRGGFTPK
jgi:hypothetical protein